MRSQSIWVPLTKLTIYTVVIALATALLVLIIVNGRTGATSTYQADFDDVSGLTANDNVKIAGVAVGKVSSVKVVGHGQAQVEFVVDRDVRVPDDVVAAVKYQNLVGGRYLDLERQSGDSEITGVLRSGGTIPNTRTVPALNLTVLFGGFRPLFQALQPDELNRFAEEILQTLQGEGGTVESLLAHTASLTTTVADRDQVIGSLIDDLNDVLGTVSGRDRELSTLLIQLQRFVSGLSRDRAAIGSAIGSIGSLTRSVTGLLVDIRSPLMDDIAHLGGLARNLDSNKGKIGKEIRVLPKLLGRVDRTASYGSWFQFYLCDLGGSFTTGGHRNMVTSYRNSQSRCSS